MKRLFLLTLTAALAAAVLGGCSTLSKLTGGSVSLPAPKTPLETMYYLKGLDDSTVSYATDLEKAAKVSAATLQDILTKTVAINNLLNDAKTIIADGGDASSNLDKAAGMLQALGAELPGFETAKTVQTPLNAAATAASSSSP